MGVAVMINIFGNNNSKSFIVNGEFFFPLATVLDFIFKVIYILL